MNKIIALWGVPRSVSSAFNEMMKRRGDVVAYHEPFGEAYYYGEDRYAPRTVEEPPRPGLTQESVWQRMQEDRKEKIVFFKEFPFQMSRFLSDDLLDQCTHSFLIRDPARTVESNFAKWPDIDFDELGFRSQHELFERLTDKLGAPPPVIDAEELLDNPPALLEAWSEAVGLPFKPEALNWGDDKPENVSWFEGDRWHSNLRASDGFKRQSRNYPPIASNPRMVELYMDCVPYYQALYPHRLKAKAQRVVA